MNLSKRNKLWLSLAAIVLMVADAKTAHARSEQKCLERIGFAEARNQSIEGVQDVMNAAVKNARQLKISVCSVKAKQKTPPNHTELVYRFIAKNVLAGVIKPRTNANSWRSKGQKAKDGVSVGKTGKHEFFYVSKL